MGYLLFTDALLTSYRGDPLPIGAMLVAIVVAAAMLYCLLDRAAIGD